jgi:hypothetical protein
MKQYLTEYKVTLPGNNIKEGLQVSYGDSELTATKKADEYLRMTFVRADIYLGDTVEV